MNGTELLIRGFWAFCFSAAMGYAVFSKTERETTPGPADGKPRYTPFLPAVILPGFLVTLSLLETVLNGAERSFQAMLSVCFGIFLHISVYYLLLLLVMPLIRKQINARTCAVLWLLPNYLYITQMSYMEVSAPRWILRFPGDGIRWAALAWLAGFLGVLGWKTVSHLLFRQRILSPARPVNDPAVLDLWLREQRQAGIKRPVLQLVISPAVRTPLSIGFFRRSIRVVLPERDYSQEELTLIFRHEIVHIGREDAMTKFFLVFCTAMCWFNPLMWFAMRRSAEDLELSCDETVLLDADDGTRRKYAQLLLRTAGDERGFTTCLSASAASLRYRLANVIRPRERMAGSLAVGCIFFALIMSCGYVSLAYDQADGQTYLFSGGEASAYTIESIRQNDGREAAVCTDPQALNDYLAALSLSRMTGNYSFSDEDVRLQILYCGPDGLVSMDFRDTAVMVTPLGGHISTTVYCCSDGMDWAYLDTLLVPET